MYRALPISWMKVVFLCLYHGMAIAAFWQPFELRYAPIMLGCYLWFGFSGTLYLHRYLSHHAFETKPWIAALGFLGVAVGQLGTPRGWVGHHRLHHAHADGEGDPHSPAAGFFYAYLGWNLRMPPLAGTRAHALGQDAVDRSRLCKLADDRPIVLFGLHVAAVAVMVAWLGWGGAMWCLYLPLVAVYHGAWAVNALCHSAWFGSRCHEVKDASRNSWPLALLTLGDAWHNNHHADPARACHGTAWWQPDPTTWLIMLLERLGLAWDVRWAPGRGATPAEPQAS